MTSVFEYVRPGGCYLIFPKIVVEGGRIVEDGAPGDLAEDSASRYSALLAAEEEVRETIWSRSCWRRLRLEGGRLRREGTRRRA